MRVSVIAHCFPDYLMEVVSDGLIRLLGRENVHFDFNRAFPPDCMRASVYERLREPNHFDLYDGDALIIASRSGLSRLGDWLNKTGGRRKAAVIDGEDDTTIRGDLRTLSSVYFKRESLLSGALVDKVRPLPFGAIPEPIPNVPRTRPFAFLGKSTSPIRDEIWKALGQGDLISKDKYNEVLASSIVGISAKGAGWDTYRYWETAYFGCALLAHRPQIRIPENFVDGQEVVFFDTARQCKERLDRLLSDPAYAKAIGAGAKRACDQRHLSTNRARTVLEALT